MSVSNTKTGEVLVEKKFTKSSMEDLLKSEEFLPHIETMLSQTLIKNFSGNLDVDANSYEEVRAVAMDLAEAELK